MRPGQVCPGKTYSPDNPDVLTVSFNEARASLPGKELDAVNQASLDHGLQ